MQRTKATTVKRGCISLVRLATSIVMLHCQRRALFTTLRGAQTPGSLELFVDVRIRLLSIIGC